MLKTFLLTMAWVSLGAIKFIISAASEDLRILLGTTNEGAGLAISIRTFGNLSGLVVCDFIFNRYPDYSNTFRIIAQLLLGIRTNRTNNSDSIYDRMAFVVVHHLLKLYLIHSFPKFSYSN